MKYLLDTNVISELIVSSPDGNVVSFLERLNEDDLCLSVITIGEIRFGIEKLEDGTKKEKLLNWLHNDLFERFKHRIIDIDIDTMLKWGYVNGKLKKIGRPIPVMDSLIASTVLSRNLILLTRNEKDFKDLDIEMINPFKSV